MKNINHTTKKLENLAVVRGTTKNLARDFNKSVDFGSQSQMSVQALQSAKVRGHGYLYSQGKYGLLEDLRGPYANPSQSPLKSIQRIYDQKSIEMSEIGHQQVILQLDQNDIESANRSSILRTHNSQDTVTALRLNEDQTQEDADAETLIDDPSTQTFNNLENKLALLPEKSDSAFVVTAKKTVTSKSKFMK
jgi:hypothetical protein